MTIAALLVALGNINVVNLLGFFGAGAAGAVAADKIKSKIAAKDAPKDPEVK